MDNQKEQSKQMAENKEIIGESRASKYIIPFSKDEVRIGDRLIMKNSCMNLSLIHEWNDGTRQLIDYHSISSCPLCGKKGNIKRFIDRTPKLFTRLCDRFMDWLESHQPA